MRTQQRPSAQNAAKQASQEFFPRSRGVEQKQGGFIFNKAPINKNAAFQEAKSKVVHDQDAQVRRGKQGRSGAGGFLSKLYQDDDELDNLRVVGAVDDEDEEVLAARNSVQEAALNKRKLKASDKTASTAAKIAPKDPTQVRVGRLQLKKGALGMFAVCEVAADHLIVNHTRNTKGFISLKDTTLAGKADKFFKVGHFVMASVVAELGSTQSGQIYDFKHGSGVNRKVQMTLDPSVINRQLSSKNASRGMILQAQVESKEAKGYILNLGFKDETKGFLKYRKEEEGDKGKASKVRTLKVGQLVHVFAKSIIESSKVVKCEQLRPGSHCTAEHCVQQAAGDDKAVVTTGHVKPGFLVSGKVQRVMDNGLEISFLGGITGTCFIDHALEEPASGSITDFKVGQKVVARVISADPMQKKITLSLMKNIINWSPASSKKSETAALSEMKVGTTYEGVTVTKALYGGSYLVQLPGERAGTAFLHKTHSKAEVADEDGDDQEAKDPQDHKNYKLLPADELLQEGQVLKAVRVKEINWFDARPVVTLRDSLLAAGSLNYHQIEVGQFLKATISKVDPDKRSIMLRVNDFVQGSLHIEHMADTPLKVIPPKLQEVGKELSFRVLHVDASTRLIEFTKKDTLMKDDCPVYKTHRDIKKGDKFVGVVVSKNEHGYIARSFGTLKGLLTFEDINAKQEKAAQSEKPTEYKIGSIIKAYCLFKKAGKGVALTLSKKKATAEGADPAASTAEKQALDSFLPGDQEIEELFSEDRFTTMAKASRSQDLVGQVHKFRLVASGNEDKKYFLLKSTDAVKKSKNFVAVLPRCLVPAGVSLKESQEVEGLVLQMIGGGGSQQVPLVSVQRELVLLKDEIFKGSAEEQMTPGQTFVGVVNGLVGKAGQVGVRFLNGIQRTMKVKDLNVTQGYASVYSPGKVIRVAVNKSDRLCAKERVLEACLAARSTTSKSDKEVQFESFASRFLESQGGNTLKIGETVEATVQLVKDYGIIAQIASEQGEAEAQTGFIVNEQKGLRDSKKYKLGHVLNCCVLDIDPVKRIVDLSEKLASVKEQKSHEKEFKVGRECLATIELNKESYLIVSVKSSKKAYGIGICLLQNFNEDDSTSPYQNVQIGDDLAVKVIGHNTAGFLELLPVVKKERRTSSGLGGGQAVELREGAKFKGQIRSIKNQQIFIHAKDTSGSLVLGRLLQSECESPEEFNKYSKGDLIDVRVLKVSKAPASRGAAASWAELTRKKAHMDKPEGLDEDAKTRSLLSQNDLKKGQKLESALLLGPAGECALNLRHSKPLLVRVSAMLTGTVPFNHIIPTKDLAKFGSDILLAQKLQGGSQVAVTYLGDGNFSLLPQRKVAPPQFSKGDLVTARFVKVVRGRGVTVQIDTNVFGFIEQCEITDQLAGNVFKLLEERKVFAARIIDADAAGKWQLSSRESVIDEESWTGAVGPQGPSKQFLAKDKEQQQRGNVRNKILKYGAQVALSRGDLALGYITNIGKAGCFVQIGHKCTVRAGLNELSDAASFDFVEEMPVGRMVLGRITRVDEQANGEKRMHFSTRQSIVVYGVGAIDRNKLELDSEVTSIVMAVAEGKALCQLKGTYLKLKVKDYGDEALRPGDHVISKLTKIDKQKISSTFVSKTASLDQLGAQMTDEERLAESIFNSVATEAKREIRAIKALNKADQAKADAAADFDPKAIEMVRADEDEIAEQIKDLKELDESVDEVNDDEEMEAEDDSDAEEMQKLIQLDQSSSDDSAAEEGEDDDEDDIDADADEEMESEQADEQQDEDEDSSAEEDQATGKDAKRIEKAKKNMLKKRTLKERLKEEQEIRQKEKRMRSETDKPQDIDDFERLLVGNQDQSYLWIQYMAFMLDNVGLDAARKVVDRATQSVSMASEQNKLNIWTAYMNLESNFGTQETLEQVTKRALDVNERRKVYLNLIDIYKSSMKFDYIEAIYRQLSKKFGNSLEIWSGYLEFLIEMRHRKKEEEGSLQDVEFSEPKQVLQRALQALSADQHVNIISKFGMLEFKYGAPENGRTMFEGIVSNYPKRMDIWSIYMDMEMKYGQANVTQARHLFERCLSNQSIQKKPKKMKLVFQKYMEFENQQGNKVKLDELRERVEQYLSKVYGDKDGQEGAAAADKDESDE